jgi:LPS export ABC transporter protein LptC
LQQNGRTAGSRPLPHWLVAMRRRLWAAAAIAIVAASAAFWLTARRITPEPPESPPVPPEIQVKFERITVRGRAEGDRLWELEARSIELTKDQKLTRLDGLRRATLLADGKPQLSASAKWAKLESPSRDIELGGGVEVRSDSGMALRADSLRWRASEERLVSTGPVTMDLGDTTVNAARAYYLAQPEQIVSDGGVKIKQGQNYLTGTKLVADLRAQTLEIVGGVRMRLRVNPSRDFTGSEGPLGAMKGLLEKAPKEAR